MTDSTVASFASIVDLDPVSATSFVGPPAPERGGRVYGGQFLAQAVAAAYRTVGDDRRIHSLHSYFLRAGDVDDTTRWEVDVVRDGRSFSIRSVTGLQGEKEMFVLTASFHVPEPGPEYLPPSDIDIAALPRPDDVPTTYVDFARSHPDYDGTWFGADRPMEIRYINPPELGLRKGKPVTEPQLTWTRLAETVGPATDDPVVLDAGLAYLADATLVDHVLLPHGYRWHDRRLTGASLDHAMWFHRPSRPDHWLLYDQRVEATAGARGLATGRFYTEDGALVATCSQEGLIRWSERT